MLGRITDDDNGEFQASYHCCSRWAQRLDKHPGFACAAPTVAEMAYDTRIVQT
jgi:hypothetical protein